MATAKVNKVEAPMRDPPDATKHRVDRPVKRASARLEPFKLGSSQASMSNIKEDKDDRISQRTSYRRQRGGEMVLILKVHHPAREMPLAGGKCLSHGSIVGQVTVGCL